MWSGPKGASVQDRLDRQNEAKKALLERFKKQPGPGDAEFEKRQAELKSIAEARRQREEERERRRVEEEARRVEQARVKAERDARESERGCRARCPRGRRSRRAQGASRTRESPPR